MEQHQIKELSSPSSIELTRKCKKIEDLCKIVYEMGMRITCMLTYHDLHMHNIQ